MFFVYLIIALAAGVALATQSAINTQLAKAMSGEAVIATFISFAVEIGRASCRERVLRLV